MRVQVDLDRCGVAYHQKFDIMHARWAEAFEIIYSTDLVYRENCWKLCGDAHCCNFTRYKSQFKLMRSHAQELPLLPGEFEFLKGKGWLAQFGDFDHKVAPFQAGQFMFQAESIVSRREGGCVCDHDTRPTICRLYPLLPVFRLTARDGEAGAQLLLTGVERVAIYDDFEQSANLSPACQLDALPFGQVPAFLRIAAALASNPAHALYLEAYRRTKAHVAARVVDRWAATQARTAASGTIFQSFESALLRRQAIDHASLSAEVERVVTDFAERFGVQNLGLTPAPHAPGP